LIEIELKCALTPQLLEKVHAKTQAMDFKGTVQNQDIYYDTPAWDLLRRAVFVRVRNGSRVEFKFNEDIDQSHVQSTEHVFPLSLSHDITEKMNALFAYFLPDWVATASFEDAMKQNGLIELANIANTRKEYTGEGIILSVDHVKGLGDFLEVEVQVEEEDSNTSQIQEQLQAFVSDLTLQHIKVGYVELWLYEHNPEAYAAGRYHL
jgi:adenylate cyclase, class 2